MTCDLVCKPLPSPLSTPPRPCHPRRGGCCALLQLQYPLARSRANRLLTTACHLAWYRRDLVPDASSATLVTSAMTSLESMMARKSEAARSPAQPWTNRIPIRTLHAAPLTTRQILLAFLPSGPPPSKAVVLALVSLLVVLRAQWAGAAPYSSCDRRMFLGYKPAASARINVRLLVTRKMALASNCSRTK